MGAMKKTKVKQKNVCRYCENEGLIWVNNKKEGTSSLYRCPFCQNGKKHPMTDIPFPPKPICNCDDHTYKTS